MHNSRVLATLKFPRYREHPIREDASLEVFEQKNKTGNPE